jgi:LemA protein
VAEQYPQLRATENFRQLQTQLEETEQKIAVSRQIYNDAVFKYDTACETLPTNIIAGMFNFGPRRYFEIEEPVRAVPQAQF